MFVVSKADNKPPKPKTKVKGAHKAKRLDALARRMQRMVSADLYTGLQVFKKSIKAKEMREAWESGNYDKLDTYIPWEKLPSDLEKFKDRLEYALFGSAGLAFGQLPLPVSEKLRFDANNPAVRSYIDKKVGRLIADVTHDTRVQVREIVMRHFQKPMKSKDVVEEIRNSVGLHERYKDALNRYKDGLIEAGKSEEEVDKLYNRYSDQLLEARAKTVGRTEIRQTTNHAQRTVWREAGNQGLIDKAKSKRIWVVDGNPCEECEPMDGEETTLDEPYYTDDGEAVEPGEIHPNCECIEILETE